MKKILLASLVATLVGCGGSDSSSTPAPVQPEPTPTPTPVEPAPEWVLYEETHEGGSQLESWYKGCLMLDDVCGDNFQVQILTGSNFEAKNVILAQDIYQLHTSYTHDYNRYNLVQFFHEWESWERGKETYKTMAISFTYDSDPLYGNMQLTKSTIENGDFVSFVEWQCTPDETHMHCTSNDEVGFYIEHKTIQNWLTYDKEMVTTNFVKFIFDNYI